MEHPSPGPTLTILIGTLLFLVAISAAFFMRKKIKYKYEKKSVGDNNDPVDVLENEGFIRNATS